MVTLRQHYIFPAGLRTLEHRALRPWAAPPHGAGSVGRPSPHTRPWGLHSRQTQVQPAVTSLPCSLWRKEAEKTPQIPTSPTPGTAAPRSPGGHPVGDRSARPGRTGCRAGGLPDLPAGLEAQLSLRPSRGPRSSHRLTARRFSQNPRGGCGRGFWRSQRDQCR